MIESNFVVRERCPVCKAEHKEELYSAAFTHPPVSTYLEKFYSPVGNIEFDFLEEANFVVDECLECGLIFQRLVLNDRFMTRLYEKWIDPNSIFLSKVKKRKVEYYTRLAREIELCINYFGRKPSELQLLDFAMGWGDWCRMAQAFGCSAFGVELSQTRIDYAKTFGVSTIKWEEIPEHQFDFINAEQVFEHLANPLETLQHLCISLKAGGIVKISVPNGWDIKKRLAILDWTALKGSKNTLYPISPLEHINCFRHESLLRMASLADLVPIQISTQIRKKRLVDFTLREFLSPVFNLMKRVINRQEVGSTHLFFQKRVL